MVRWGWGMNRVTCYNGNFWSESVCIHPKHYAPKLLTPFIKYLVCHTWLGYFVYKRVFEQWSRGFYVLGEMLICSTYFYVVFSLFQPFDTSHNTNIMGYCVKIVIFTQKAIMHVVKFNVSNTLFCFFLPCILDLNRSAKPNTLVECSGSGVAT